MKKILFILMIFLSIICITSCQTSKINIVYIDDYQEQIELVKNNFPEIYNLYKNGEIIIDNVYTYTSKKDYREKVHISYRYRQYNTYRKY